MFAQSFPLLLNEFVLIYLFLLGMTQYTFLFFHSLRMTCCTYPIPMKYHIQYRCVT